MEYIIKKPQQLELRGFRLVEVCILSGRKNRPRQFRAGDFDILIHVVRIILLKRAFSLKDQWRPGFE